MGIISRDDKPASDGGAFVLQPDSAALGESIDGLGFRTIKNSLAVSFDAVQDQQDDDPAYDIISEKMIFIILRWLQFQIPVAFRTPKNRPHQ